MRDGIANTHIGVPFPIGGWQIEKERHYRETHIQIQPGDSLYLGSDGYQSQFGGKGNRDRKYGSKKLHDFLTVISALPTAEQEFLLKEELYHWQGEHPQMDDILVMGIRF